MMCGDCSQLSERNVGKILIHSCIHSRMHYLYIPHHTIDVWVAYKKGFEYLLLGREIDGESSNQILTEKEDENCFIRSQANEFECFIWFPTLKTERDDSSPKNEVKCKQFYA